MRFNNPTSLIRAMCDDKTKAKPNLDPKRYYDKTKAKRIV